ncbi:unnamed protein product [Blepharisma stoltei]|uniref:Kinesin-like protein n=1 Tax=Blepharisma stoltei TaxID=1481888 RepID=A0AAU9J609_9CILI|nr:unnamed protein product [Blepharisma stoltei]
MEENEDSGLGNIKVVCRFRPLNQKEKEISMQTCVDFSPDKRTVHVRAQSESAEPLKFNFDYVFDPSSHQSSVYDVAAKPVVESVMQGFNGTVFAYGQTSSGKTFTMSGPDFTDQDLMGIIPRMVGTVFDQIAMSEEYLEFQVKVSYCEIYMEKIKDLLEPSKNNLKIHEDRIRGVYISGISERYANDDQEVYDLMALGLDNREVGYTNMNAGSSRSHSIFIITISQSNTKDFSSKVGKLYLVDLAGSEKVGKTGAEGKRLEEAKNINKSLTTLGQVISALTDGKSTHVPYRDSKLTRVLQDSLGGNSKTTLIVTCSPSPYNESETVSTLRFGIRAKAIKNKPKVNREYTVAELKLLLSKSREEIVMKDKRIFELETSLKQSGIQIPEIIESTEDEDSSFLNMSKASEYDEVIQELEEARTRLSEECQASSLLRQELGVTQTDLESLKAVNEYMMKELEKANNLNKALKTSSEAKDEKICTLTDVNEKLVEEVKALTEKELKLEQAVIGKDVELEQLRTDVKKLQAALLEKESEIKTQWEDFDTDEGVQKVGSASTIPSWDLMKEEKELWDNEKKLLVVDLQNKTNSIISLNQQLDEFKKKCKELEVALNRDEKDLQTENKILQRSLEQLTKKYHILSAKKAKLKIEGKANEKKMKRITDKCTELENKVNHYREKYKSAKFSLKQINLQQETARASISHFGGVPHLNIRKTIAGGSALSRRTLTFAARQNILTEP